MEREDLGQSWLVFGGGEIGTYSIPALSCHACVVGVLPEREMNSDDIYVSIESCIV
jgi:hypothetical protein